VKTTKKVLQLTLIESQTDLDVPVDWVSESTALSRYLNRGFGNAYDFIGFLYHGAK
jgi:hypothetical protein